MVKLVPAIDRACALPDATMPSGLIEITVAGRVGLLAEPDPPPPPQAVNVIVRAIRLKYFLG